MAWYNTGNIALTNGSATVTGSGTNFLVGAQIGEALYAPDGKLYEIQTINSATVITLASNYLGSTATGQSYQIIPTQSLVADLASDVTDLISDFANVRDYAGNGKFNDGAVGTPGITFTQDQDNGLYRIGANNWALAAGGQQVVNLTTTAMNFPDNSKAIFGAGSDLQIYHDGSNSYISEVGTGELVIQARDAVTIEDGTSGDNYIYMQRGNKVSLFYAGVEKLATTATGIDVTGTATMDGLVVDTGSVGGFKVTQDAGAGVRLTAYQGTTNSNVRTAYVDAQRFVVSTGEPTGTTVTERLRIDSAGNVGIGTSSPSQLLHLTSSGFAYARFNNSSYTGIDIGQHSNGNIYFNNRDNTSIIMQTNNTERMRIDATGLIQIGNAGSAASPTIQSLIDPDTGIFWGGADILGFSTGGSERMRIDANGWVNPNANNSSNPADSQGLHFGWNLSNGGGESLIVFNKGAGATGGLVFSDNSANGTPVERMRIDASGNLLVGTTDANPTNNNTNSAADKGIVFSGGQGWIANATYNETTAYFNRTGTDGSIIELIKSGTSVGSIGSRSSGANLYVAFRTETTGDGCGLTGSSASDGAIIPSDGNGAAIDNHIDLGASATRFDDIYATNGTIQTSDRNEKQDIEGLSEAEQRVAVATKGLLRKFRWKSSVAEKGDEARTHFGIIAQDLQAAFEAEGLDAGDYAMFINSTWTDEETGEERSRMGVRYSELLAFIIAAI